MVAGFKSRTFVKRIPHDLVVGLRYDRHALAVETKIFEKKKLISLSRCP
jgi:hypothetical protein